MLVAHRDYGKDVTTTKLEWKLAQEAAAKLVRPGPKASLQERRELVADLRSSSERAVQIVADTTQLEPALGAEVCVVDRSNWSRSVIAGMSAMIGDAIPKTAASTAQAAGLEIGALVAVLASRVLGQYDPWVHPEGGRLTLVAPNVLATERALEINPQAFRMWVCLHEQTHVTQFTTAPWLKQHISNLAQGLATSLMDKDQARERVTTLARGFIDLVRDPNSPSLLEITATDAELAQIDQITAVMSLLEGHADVIMDDVDESVVPGVDAIRRAFDARRSGKARGKQRSWDQIVRRLLGLDTKLAQYREGARFVRYVENRVGRAGLNTAWTSAEALPTIAELRQPQLWIDRLHP